MSIFKHPLDNAFILQKKKRLKKQLLEKDNLIDKKIAILSGSTIGEIQNILELFLLDNGIKPEFLVGDFNRYYEEIMFNDGDIKNFAPDYIYIHTTNKNLENLPVPSDSEETVNEKLENEFNRLTAVYEKALSFGSIVLINNFEMPFYRLFGNKDVSAVQGVVNFTLRLNLKISEYVNSKENIYINDINYLSSLIGIDNWFSLENWYLYKYALSVEKIPDLAFSLSNIIKSTLGKNKKSVILDLDNTLWGGVIGDDGADGIQIGKEAPAGMSYTEFQYYLKNLSSLGIMLNVCSKNEHDIAKTGFDLRKDAPLSYEDFISFKANWNPKHENIENIASEINIGLDSFVFIDDNPAEREIVRQHISAIEVPEVKAPEDYIKAIDRNGYFEITTFTKDDAKRNDMYKENAKRAAVQSSFTDYSAYLLSLDMSSDIGHFSSNHSERITQLINKTNQFNFTTRRYTQGEVEEIIQDKENYISIYANLVDKFGDNGITTCFISSIKDNVANIDLWVMSCRVFKRDLEFAVFDYFINKCKEMGVNKITANYIPTAKNIIIKDFYETLGFTLTLDSEQEKRYILDVPSEYKNKNAVIKMTVL